MSGNWEHDSDSYVEAIGVALGYGAEWGFSDAELAKLFGQVLIHGRSADWKQALGHHYTPSIGWRIGDIIELRLNLDILYPDVAKQREWMGSRHELLDYQTPKSLLTSLDDSKFRRVLGLVQKSDRPHVTISPKHRL